MLDFCCLYKLLENVDCFKVIEEDLSPGKLNTRKLYERSSILSASDRALVQNHYQCVLGPVVSII